MGRPDAARWFTGGGMRHPVLVALHRLARRRATDQDIIGRAIQLLGDLCDHVPIRAHAELVANAEHHERRMVFVGPNDPQGLLADPVVDVGRFAQSRRERFRLVNPVVHPIGCFHLQVQAEFIGDSESDVGRTPGVKPNVIESRLFVNAEHTFPPRSVGRRRIAVRVDGAIDVAAQKQPVIIQQQMLAVTAECAKAELNRSLTHRTSL